VVVVDDDADIEDVDPDWLERLVVKRLDAIGLAERLVVVVVDCAEEYWLGGFDVERYGALELVEKPP
jgi:hypothetical protein